MSIAGFLWLRSSLPQLDGEIVLEDLKAPVEVLRNKEGLVTIKAKTELDAYRALGFVHAQDRLWQMDFMRRAGSGRLSEVVGEATLPIDKFMRTLGFSQLVKENYKLLSEDTKSAFEAYSQGVNDYLDNHRGTLSPEFHVLGYEPEQWAPTDSLLWGRLMALQLSDNFNRELLRLRLLKNLPLDEVNSLWPSDDKDPLIIPNFQLSKLSQEEPIVGSIPLPWPLAPKDASNAWVVSGDRTQSGKPLLANDPHLALDSPGPWYLVRMETPNFTWAGATSPGVPLLVLGHNSKIAWGFTTTHSDTQDLFLEKLNPDDTDQYLTSDGYQDFISRKEIINIKGGAAEELIVRHSRHGPVLSPVLRNAENKVSGHVLALSWTALREDDQTAQALYDINHAKTQKDFDQAITKFHSPQQTLVMADTEGNIQLAAPGRVPIRRNGDGRLPVAGWDDKLSWIGTISPNKLPQSLNPDNGKLVTANNRLVGPEYPYLITRDWPNSYRSRRIHELLDNKENLSIEDMLNFQMDTYSIAANELLDILLETPTSDPKSLLVLEHLKQWDRHLDLNSTAPSLLYSWVYWLNRASFGNLPSDASSFQSPNILRISRRLRDQPENWCFYGEKLANEGNCVAQLTESLRRVASNFNPDEEKSWGELHSASFQHQIFDRIPVLGELLKLKISSAGGHDTINRASPSMKRGDLKEFPNIHGPSYRAVYDLSDLDNSRFLIATGQSGNPLSSFYGNFLVRWRDGNYIKLDQKTDQNSQYRLILRGNEN